MSLVRVRDLVRSVGFTTDTPTGQVRFMSVLTDKDQTPVAYGEVFAGKWEFINGHPGFKATGSLEVVSDGKPQIGWTFVVDYVGNTRLLSDSRDIEVPRVNVGDHVEFTNTLTIPAGPLPDWLLA